MNRILNLDIQMDEVNSRYSSSKFYSFCNIFDIIANEESNIKEEFLVITIFYNI